MDLGNITKESKKISSKTKQNSIHTKRTTYPRSLLIIIATCIVSVKCKCKHTHEPTKQRGKSTLIDPCPTPPSSPEPFTPPPAPGSSTAPPASGSSTPSYGSGSSTAPPASGSSTPSYGSGSSTPSPPSSPVHHPFAGLPNLGNTCYMNAVLQIITALYADDVPNNSSLKDLITKINSSNKPLDKSEVKAFIEKLPEDAKKMAKSRSQQDSSEFIDHLNKDPCFDFLSKYNYDSTKRFFIKNKDDIQGQDEEALIFSKDGTPNQEKALIVHFNEASKDLGKMIDLDREEFVKYGDLQINHQDYTQCSKDSISSFVVNNKTNLDLVKYQEEDKKHYSEHYIQQTIITKLPSKLYIQLKRFKFIEGTQNGIKITDPVDGTPEISIKPDPSLNNSITFHLNGFILHDVYVYEETNTDGDHDVYEETNTDDGHYTAYVKRENKWYQADDTSIIEKTESEAIEASKKAYLLFYKGLSKSGSI